MDFYQILTELEQVDPEVPGRLDARRRVFRHLAGAGRKLAAAAVPGLVGAVLSRAYAQTPLLTSVLQVLNVALRLEYLEMYFYQQRTALTGLSGTNSAALARLATDEANHVAFLRTAISAGGGTPVADPTAAQFDFSGGRLSSTNTAGPFGDWRTNPATYLALAESFEDLGIRAYKGAAPLTQTMANKTVLTALLGIHGVEARHSAQVRAMRRAGASSASPSQAVAVSPYSTQPKSWVSGMDNGGAAPAYTTPIYGAGNNAGAATYGASGQTGTGAGVTFEAESNVVQAGITLAALPNTSGFPAAAFSEAFDEGLDVGTVFTIARQFTTSSSTFFVL